MDRLARSVGAQQQLSHGVDPENYHSRRRTGFRIDKKRREISVQQVSERGRAHHRRMERRQHKTRAAGRGHGILLQHGFQPPGIGFETRETYELL